MINFFILFSKILCVVIDFPNPDVPIYPNREYCIVRYNMPFELKPPFILKIEKRLAEVRKFRAAERAAQKKKDKKK